MKAAIFVDNPTLVTVPDPVAGKVTKLPNPLTYCAPVPTPVILITGVVLEVATEAVNAVPANTAETSVTVPSKPNPGKLDNKDLLIVLSVASENHNVSAPSGLAAVATKTALSAPT